MLKYSSFAIVASFIGLWINSFLKSEYQIFVGFILILSFGILHGANDIALIKKVNSYNIKQSYFKILLYYLIIVLFGAILFYFIPWLALFIFIIISGYHFGEQQWNTQLSIKNIWIKSLFETVYGLIILFIIFTFHASEVKKIMFAITSVEIPKFLFLLILEVLTVLYLGLSFYFLIKLENFKHYFFQELFYLMIFSIIFKVSSLIWGFALYFILWHSIPSMLDQMRFLFGQVNFNTFKLYFRSGFLYWIISLFGITILYFILRDQKIFNALFFSFLASITFPHVLVIIKMLDNKK